jgi:peptidylglycine monooxygenase
MYSLLSILLIFSSVFLLITADDASNTLNVLMPDVVAHHVDDYLCTSVELDADKPTYITAFNPSATSKDAHHILLFGCLEPGSHKKTWNCGEMAYSDGNSAENYESGPTCAAGSSIIYAWALDADKTELPKDVAFKIGGSTSIRYLVLQVHYSNIDKFKVGETDRSGLILTVQPTPTPKTAGVLLLETDGAMAPHSMEVFETACEIKQDIVMHPFAFRTHAHKLGLVNSAYRVRGEDEDQEWTEIGRRSPQLPQMFYPTEKDVPIKQGDHVAGVCTMYNTQSHVVRIGSTGVDEMCNFYMMYWVDGDELLQDSVCASPGPPYYYFAQDQNLNVEKIPADAFRIPPPPNGPAPGEPVQGGHHMMMGHKPKPHHRQQRYQNIY